MHLIRNVSFICAALACNLQAQTVVVNNNLSLFSPIPSQPSFYGATIWQDAAKTNPTSVTFTYTGTQISMAVVHVDEGSDWYVVQGGDAFSKANTEAGVFPKFSPIGGATVGAGDFWLGISTGLSSAPSSRTVFGWAHLMPVNGQLTMIENAVSYDSPGIIVGTTTVVPEPATISLVACGIVLAVSQRRRRRE